MLYFCDTLAASHLKFFFFIKRKQNHYKTEQPHEKTNKTYRKQKPDEHESKPANVSNNVSAERTKLDKGILNLNIYKAMTLCGKLEN